MTIDEARSALVELERGYENKTQSFGPQQWVENFNNAVDLGRAKSHEVAWALVFEGTSDERRYALAFWNVVGIPQGVSDAVADLYLSENPADLNLRQSLGLSTAHQFSDDVGRRLAARFAADPDGERELAGNALKYDAQGAAWDALIRLVLKTDDVAGLYKLFDAAYQADRSEDFFAAIKNKPQALLKEMAGSVPLRMRQRFLQITGITFP